MRTHGRFISLAALAAGLLVSGLAGGAQAACGDGGTVDGIAVPTSADSPTVAKICDQKVLRAAVAPFAPHGFQDANGEFRGAAVEIVAPAVAEALGVDLEVLPIGWDTVVAGLQAGRYELITTGLTYTPERDEIIDYALTAVGGTCYAVRKDSPAQSLEDLNSADVRIGVFTGTSFETDLPKVFPNAQFDSALQGAGGGYRLQDVLANRIDAAPIDNVAGPAISARYPSLRIIPAGDECLTNPKPIDRIGIGLPQDPAFKTFMEAMVAKHQTEIDKKMHGYLTPDYIVVGEE
jgi:arginine/lysine/histidine transporter system substrate-binding protein